MNIVLHQFIPLYGLPNASPFCIKLETYLRIAGLPYTVSTIKGRPKSATRKGPYVEYKGEMLTDSGLIIERLEHDTGHRLDGKLTLAERSVSLGFQRLIEEHLYWVMVYARWVDPEHDAETAQYAATVLGVKGLMAKILVPLIRKNVRKALANHGLGRHPPQTMWHLGIADIQALAHWLGTRPWCFGDHPTVLDAVLFAFVAATIRTPWDFPLKAAILKYRNLVDHTDRMMQRYYPELKAAA